MDRQIWIAITFIAFLLSFTVVGIYSATQKQNTTNDYLLASRNVNPRLTVLSADKVGKSNGVYHESREINILFAHPTDY